MLHLDEKTRFSLMVAIHGFRRTIWMYLITAVATGLAMGSVVMFIMRPGFWLVWLFGLRLAWLVVQEGKNWWWERWTGPYQELDVSFLLPPYLQENIAAMIQGTYQPAWAEPLEYPVELDSYQPRHSQDT